MARRTITEAEAVRAARKYGYLCEKVTDLKGCTKVTLTIYKTADPTRAFIIADEQVKGRGGG